MMTAILVYMIAAAVGSVAGIIRTVATARMSDGARLGYIFMYLCMLIWEIILIVLILSR